MGLSKSEIASPPLRRSCVVSFRGGGLDVSGLWEREVTGLVAEVVTEVGQGVCGEGRSGRWRCGGVDMAYACGGGGGGRWGVDAVVWCIFYMWGGYRGWDVAGCMAGLMQFDGDGFVE